MKAININYILVKRVEEVKKEGEFQAVEVQDSFVYKGKVVRTPDRTVYIGNEIVDVGHTIVFTKYSPDTHEVTVDGEKMKMVKVEDILYLD